MAAGGIPRVADLHTTAGLGKGSPSGDAAGVAYLAPECVHDPIAEPRPYTDVYGLGLILYELLTGRSPFTGTTAAEVREEVLRRDPEPPSTRNPHVSPELEWLVLRCLRKNPWRRFTRAYDLVSKVQRLPEVDAPRKKPGG
jgi:serine/threonine-protein kinase